MRGRFSNSMIGVAVAAVALSAVIAVSVTGTSAQAPAGAALKTPWGEPDLQGIWTDETNTPLQRAAQYANQEFFTDAQRAELDRQRSALLGRDKRGGRGTELDVSGAYNAEFGSVKRTGKRTSMIIDPPNGRIPALTPEAEKIAAADKDFRLALMQSTETCKVKFAGCNGGKYDPKPTARRAELAPLASDYNGSLANEKLGMSNNAISFGAQALRESKGCAEPVDRLRGVLVDQNRNYRCARCGLICNHLRLLVAFLCVAAAGFRDSQPDHRDDVHACQQIFIQALRFASLRQVCLADPSRVLYKNDL